VGKFCENADITEFIITELAALGWGETVEFV
jgi:hypothetical protein